MAARSGLDALDALLQDRRAVVLAGAGCSTDSGIPDYGGLDSLRRRDLVPYRAFVADPRIRSRYWARSMVGWSTVAEARPNPAHTALAELERAGVVTGVITQNVDGLHHRAGSRRVVELHGSLSRVRCLRCGGVEPRVGLQLRLLALNPEFAEPGARSAPDGDAEVSADRARLLRVPDCVTCGGLLKPDVVFFGESVPQARVAEAWAMYEEADFLLVVGSSLVVFSGYRFVARAVKERRSVAIVNVGPTRADAQATVKVEGRVEIVLPQLVDQLR